MFTDSAYNNADACRFCWMCRHLCPISNVTGKEINSARAKGLLVSLVKRGAEFDATMAETMWECCLCGACTNDCVTGYEPRSYIREARSLAIAGGLVPPAIQKVVEQILETGSMYGKFEPNASLEKTLASLPKSGDILLYIGEVCRAETPFIAEAVIHLLQKANLSFFVLKDEPYAGGYMGDAIGFVEEVKQQAGLLSKAIDATQAKTVVVIDPIDTRVMKHEYPAWNCAPKAEIISATAFIAQLVDAGKLKPRIEGGICSVHDAGALSRDLGETEPVRKLLQAMGIAVEEMFRNRDLAKSSGGALLKRYAADCSVKLAQSRWDDLLRTNAKVMVTEAPGSYASMMQAIPEDCKLTDVFELLDRACL